MVRQEAARPVRRGADGRAACEHALEGGATALARHVPGCRRCVQGVWAGARTRILAGLISLLWASGRGVALVLCVYVPRSVLRVADERRCPCSDGEVCVPGCVPRPRCLVCVRLVCALCLRTSLRTVSAI